MLLCLFPFDWKMRWIINTITKLTGVFWGGGEGLISIFEEKTDFYLSKKEKTNFCVFLIIRASIADIAKKKNAILTHQKPILLFYYIILQYLIYQMLYYSILYIKIIFTHIKIIYYLLSFITINNINYKLWIKNYVMVLFICGKNYAMILFIYDKNYEI